MSHLLIYPQNKPPSSRTNPPVSGLYSMHPITKHNYSFPYSYLFQVCGLLGGRLKGEVPTSVFAIHGTSIHWCPGWLQPAWDLVTQISLLCSHLPHHQCGQPFVASQTGSPGTGESIRWPHSLLSPSTLYWPRIWDYASAFLPWLTNLICSWPGRLAWKNSPL